MEAAGDGVLLVPLEINEVTSQNPAPGRPVTSGSAAIVGEPVTLSISGTNMFPGYNFVTGYNWHLPNAIKNYNVTATANPIQALAASDSNASTLTVYYPAVPQNDPSGSIATSGTESVSCDLTLVTGGSCTVTAPLRIVAPTVQVTGSAGPVCVSSTTSGSTAMGNLIDGFDIHFFFNNPFGLTANSSAVTPPTGFTSGSAAWMQVITDKISVTANGGGKSVILSDTNANDHGFPYPGVYGNIVPGSMTSETNDSPHAPANNPPDFELDRTFSAGMYYMWLSDVQGSIWVPLRVIGWGFQGQMNSSAGPGPWTPTSSTVNPINIVVPQKEVNWQSTSTIPLPPNP